MGTAGRAVAGPRRLAAGAAAALVVAGGTGAWALTRSSTADATSATTTTSATASVQTVRRTVTASGTIQPARRADLSFLVSGTVTSVPARVGADVQPGTVLATVGSSALSSAVAAAQATLTAARQTLADDKESGASSTRLASDAAQVATARDGLASAQSDLADAALTSPISGTVASVGVSVGDRVGSDGASGAGGGGSAGSSSSITASGSASGSASAQIVVISTDAFVVDAQVGAADLASVKKGLQVEVTPTGSSTKAFGTVSSVGVVATSSSGSATFPVQVHLTGSPTGLYAGGTANVVIVVQQRAGVLTVPTGAVLTEGGRTVVHQVVDGRTVSTPVTLGTSYGPLTEVTSGLADGATVQVVAGRTGTGAAARSGRTGTGGSGVDGGPGAGFGGGFGGVPDGAAPGRAGS